MSVCLFICVFAPLNCDKTQIKTKLKKSNCDRTQNVLNKLKNLNFYKTQKNLFLTKLNKSNSDKNQLLTQL